MNKFNPPVYDIVLIVADLDDTLTGRERIELNQELITICRQAAELWKETRFYIDSTAAWQPPS